MITEYHASYYAYEFDRPDAAKVFAEALQDFSAAYQPATDGTVTALELRLRRLRKQEAAE